MPITLIQQPKSFANAGIFRLPLEFKSDLHVGHWATEEEIPYLAQDEPIIGTSLQVTGWAVWKDKAGKPMKVTVRGGTTYILLFRLKADQDEVNAIYGNLAKEAEYKNRTGETMTNVEHRSGILGPQELTQVLGDEEDNKINKPPTLNPTQLDGGKITTKTKVSH